jgi:hypothetical protein
VSRATSSIKVRARCASPGSPSSAATVTRWIQTFVGQRRPRGIGVLAEQPGKTASSVPARPGLAPVSAVRGRHGRDQPQRTRVFTATPNDDDPTAAMTTNCGQLPMPNSEVGAVTLTTASHGRGARGDRSGRWQADPHRRRAAPRSGSGAAALPGVTTCGWPRSYGLRRVDVEAATMPTKLAGLSAPSMTRSSSPSAAVNTRSPTEQAQLATPPFRQAWL